MEHLSSLFFTQEPARPQDALEVCKLGVHLRITWATDEVKLTLLESSAGIASALVQIFRSESFLMHHYIHHSPSYSRTPGALMAYFSRRGWTIRSWVRSE